MAESNDLFLKHALTAADPDRLKAIDDLKEMIEEFGFLPLFKNEIDGFSVEEHTAREHWWTEDEAIDPWAWRAIIAREENIIYGKFFHNKAGYISKRWFPHFVNYRRDGYDFESLYEDGKAPLRSKKIMDLFQEQDRLLSSQIKAGAGFFKGGEKNFEGTISKLQMQTYLIMCDFKQKQNKKGEDYGWPLAVYTTPEHLLGEEMIHEAYAIQPQESWEKIMGQIKRAYPGIEDRVVLKVLK